MMRFSLILIIIGKALGRNENDQFVGCFQTRNLPQTSVHQFVTISHCIEECKSTYFRYSMIQNKKNCYCGNYLGIEVNSTVPCIILCSDCSNLTDVYVTGNLVPGPPQNVLLTNITDRSVHIAWSPPNSYTEITSYSIKPIIIHTFVNYVPNSPELAYSNDTFSTRIILLPATKYNITIRAVSPDGPGAPSSQIIETGLGEPENRPQPPQILSKHGKTIEIKIMETLNGNGPITSYLVIVLNQDSQQILQEELLKTYNEARNEGMSYYVTAELKPGDVLKNFTVGDGHYYGKYYNAPLDPNINYHILVGIISSFKGETKKVVSEAVISDTSTPVSSTEFQEDSPAAIIGLSVAIGLLSFMLISGIIGFIILRNRVTNRRHRLSENQELTLQGPMIEVENNGYIAEEEHNSKANYYQTLKQKIKTFSYNQIKIEPTNLLGIGRFGRVNSGFIYENDTLIPVAVYSIADKKLSTENKRQMLQDLDVLVKTEKHDNIIALVGTCENTQMLFVLLEHVSINLKDMLLGSRVSQSGRFSNLAENQALKIANSVCKGMAYLTQNKIIHRQLCARNVMITDGSVPKIGGYGLAQYHSHNNIPDFTRWTALEVFKGHQHNPKSDVWSFGCLLWEICVLGGTPYGNLLNHEISEQVTKGLRLQQMPYFSDDLYQIMLDCWQIDTDERPTFKQLIESLEMLQLNSFISYLNFNLTQNFQYEHFYPDREIAAKPVF